MNKPFRVPDAVVGKDLKKYFLEHVDHTPQPGNPHIYTVKKPLLVFKKVLSTTRDNWRKPPKEAIANLILPKGAVIYAPHGSFLRASLYFKRKMRADKARVHSICTIAPCTPLQTAVSNYDSRFEYKPKKLVKPRCPFSRLREECASGIHFFLNVSDAHIYKL